MSRQISFFQSAADTSLFLRIIEENGGKIALNGDLVTPSLAEGVILNEIESYKSKFQIVPKNLHLADTINIPRSMYVEYDICCRGNKLSRTYEIGRLYIVQSDTGVYLNECLTLYESLVKYIRRTYRYERKAFAYFAPDFWKNYQTHYYYAQRGRVPVTI